jgi:Zn-dependent protease with chaperone function/predicted  nucleic acid-binding Zn-ribbon protein
MNDALMLAASALAPALAGVLVRFVWQGAAIGALAWVALALLRDARPQARYATACLALLSCVLAPAMGLLQALLSGDASPTVAAGLPLPSIAAMTFGASPGAGFPSAFPGIAPPWIVSAWAAGVVALSLRMACGLLWAGRLRRAGDAAVPGWQARLDRLAARLGIAVPVALRLVPGGRTPLTAGWWRPVVLLPLAVVARMPVEHVEALLAHELAHVKRHDYLVNVLQGAIEALLFYHPVVWWLSHRIRIERELVADDIAATALGDRRRLALALSELDRCVPDGAPDFPLHLAHAAHGGQLMSRIQQLIRPQRRNAGALLALPLVGLALAGAAFYAQAHFAAPQEDAPAAVPRAPAAAGERSSYAFVRKDKDGFAMSGNVDDAGDIEAARARIDSDFLWFRRDGKAWVIRDAETIARARQAWAATESIEQEMQALQARMAPHEARLKALGERMQALDRDDAMESPEAKEALANVEAMSGRLQSLAERQMALAQRMRRAGDDAERARIDRDREQLDRQQAALQAELERHDAKLQALSARMAEQAAPREALGREMEAAGKPMHDIGEQMQGVGARIERAARVADGQVRSLIDQAYRNGRAEPAPALR